MVKKKEVDDYLEPTISLEQLNEKEDLLKNLNSDIVTAINIPKIMKMN